MYKTLSRKLTASPLKAVQLLRPLRGDTIIAMAIPIACIGILIEAYYRTDYHDADTSLDAQFIPSNDCVDSYNLSTTDVSPSTITSPESTSLSSVKKHGRLSNMIVQTLERDGIVIIPNAISSTVLTAVRDNLKALQQQAIDSVDVPYIFATSGNETDIRQDKIMWIRSGNPTHSSRGSDSELVGESSVSTPIGIGSDLEYCINFIRGIPYALEKNGYTLSKDHRIPKQCQLSMYRGDNISSYQRHLDSCTSTIYDLGILEYFRLSDYRQRRITIILYLNEANRPIHHGGPLRCWVSKLLAHGETPSSIISARDDAVIATDRSNFHPSFDIQPTGGTLVIFQSQMYEENCKRNGLSNEIGTKLVFVLNDHPLSSVGRVEHQVLPSSVDRYALTNWVNSAGA